MLTNEYLKRVYDTVLSRNPGEAEFHQAVLEVLESSSALWRSILSMKRMA